MNNNKKKIVVCIGDTWICGYCGKPNWLDEIKCVRCGHKRCLRSEMWTCDCPENNTHSTLEKKCKICNMVHI